MKNLKMKNWTNEQLLHWLQRNQNRNTDMAPILAKKIAHAVLIKKEREIKDGINFDEVMLKLGHDLSKVAC